MTTNVLDAIKSLSIAERMSLVEAIWDSIADEQAQLPLTDEQRAVLDERIAEMEANPSAGATWEEVKARLRGEP